MNFSKDNGSVLMNDRHSLRITTKRLHRLPPTTIEQRVCGQDLGLIRIGLTHQLDQFLDRFLSVFAGEFAHLGKSFRTPARVAGLTRFKRGSCNTGHHPASASLFSG